MRGADQNRHHYARNRIPVALYSLTVTMGMPSRMESMEHEHIAEELRDLAVPVDSLSQDPDNLRLHDKRSLKSVAGSLERFGQRIPIVTRNGIVIAGNARLAAAVQLGWTHIAAVSADNDDDMTARLFAITDNRTSDLSEFDMSGLASVLATMKDEDLDLDDLGWSDDELNDILDIELPGESPVEEPPIPEPPKEPITKPGDLILFGAYLECDACGKRQEYDPARVGEQCCDG